MVTRSRIFLPVVLLILVLIGASCADDTEGNNGTPDDAGGDTQGFDIEEGSDAGDVRDASDVEQATWGDGVIEGAEACEDGNDRSGDGCSGSCDAVEQGWSCPAEGQPCELDEGCGNGEVESGEECDDGTNDGSYGTCRINCTRAPYCGDGILTHQEECDDGNADSGDGCDDNC